VSEVRVICAVAGDWHSTTLLSHVLILVYWNKSWRVKRMLLKLVIMTALNPKCWDCCICPCTPRFLTSSLEAAI